LQGQTKVQCRTCIRFSIGYDSVSLYVNNDTFFSGKERYYDTFLLTMV